MATNNTEPLFINTESAARRIGLHPDTLRRLRRTGGGPRYARVGTAVRYDIRELDRWLEERSFRSTAEEIAKEGRR